MTTRLVLDTGVVIESHGVEYEAGACVHVLRPDGTEVGFWDCEEWREDPELVMGAILNCARDAPKLEASDPRRRRR